MENFSIEFWEIALDTIGITLCVLTAFVVVTQKRGEGRNYFKGIRKDSLSKQQEILLEWLKQSESALEAISDTIGRERLLLQKFNVKGEKKGTATRQQKKVSKKAQRHQKRQEVPSEGDQYGEIKRLGGLGLSAGEIAKKVKVGRAEVELTLQLSKMGSCTRGVA